MYLPISYDFPIASENILENTTKFSNTKSRYMPTMGVIIVVHCKWLPMMLFDIRAN